MKHALLVPDKKEKSSFFGRECLSICIVVCLIICLGIKYFFLLLFLLPFIFIVVRRLLPSFFCIVLECHKMSAAVLHLKCSCLPSEIICISLFHAFAFIFFFFFHDRIETASLDRCNGINNKFFLNSFLDWSLACHECNWNFSKKCITFPIAINESC